MTKSHEQGYGSIETLQLDVFHAKFGMRSRGHPTLHIANVPTLQCFEKAKSFITNTFSDFSPRSTPVGSRRITVYAFSV